MMLLQANNLYHRFADGSYGLRNASIDLHSDETFVLAGPNGSGKTVLMYHLIGLLKPSDGEIKYRGTPIFEDINEVRRRVGIVFQKPESQFVGQTVTEDVSFGPENYGYSDEQVEDRAQKALAAMGIEELAGSRPLYLSGGEQRKVAIAGILACDPEIVILDEPFIGLDLSGVRSMLRAILELRKNGHSLMIITHDLDKILGHADRLAIMSNGTVVASGAPTAVSPSLERYGIRFPSGPIESMTWIDR